MQSLTIFLLGFSIFYSAKGIILNGRTIHMSSIKSCLESLNFSAHPFSELNREKFYELVFYVLVLCP